jgi:hypothetical protein
MLPVFFEESCHAHRGVPQPAPFLHFKVFQDFLGLTLRSQMYVCRFRTHRSEKRLFIAVLGKRLNIDRI